MSGDTIQISGHTNENEMRLARIRQLAEAYGGSANAYAYGNVGSVHVDCSVLRAILDMYIGGRVATDKYLKPACWRRSNSFLQHLIEGYLHGDGHDDPANPRWRLGFTRNYALEASLRTLCARLGLVLTLNTAFARAEGEIYPTFRGEVRTERSGHGGEKKRGEIVRIRRAKSRRFWDVSVADEPYHFALASGVLTHNSKRNPMPESVRDRTTLAHEHVIQLAREYDYYYDEIAIAEPVSEETKARYAYGFKNEYHDGNAAPGTYRGENGFGTEAPMTRNKRSVWDILTESFEDAHFAVWPTKLAKTMILAATSAAGCCSACGAPHERVVEVVERHVGGGITKLPKEERGYSGRQGRSQNDREGMTESRKRTVGWRPTCGCGASVVPCTVLDVFSGSGTTAVVAAQNGRRAVGIDANRDYCEMAARRVREQCAQVPMTEIMR